MTHAPRVSRSGRVRALAAAASMAALGAVMVVALLAGVGGYAQAGGPDELLPDLVTRPFGSDLVLKTGAERDQLRLGNTIANRGAGPLEIFPEPDSTDCDGVEGEDRYAYQRTFSDTVDDDVFRRGQDSENPRIEAGCMAYHPKHEHWHFDDFSRYRLRHQATREIVADSTKVSFCVIDTTRPYPELPGSPPQAYYPSGGPSCDAEAVEGISIGWADTYGSGLPGQALDVTGIPKGRYCLISKADPSNRLVETDDSNNRRGRLLSLNVETGRLARVPGDC